MLQNSTPITANLIGIDEVGRGCWAGPLVACAVMLGKPIPGLKDSKKLTKTQRNNLAIQIHDQAIVCGLGWVTPLEIDELGLTAAVRLAMQRAVAEIKVPHDKIVIDGNYNFLKDMPNTETLIKADDLIPAVSAASIIAKVARDNYMIEQAKLYPGYGFETNVGYGTVVHQGYLKLNGVTPLHRRSYKPVLQCMA